MFTVKLIFNVNISCAIYSLGNMRVFVKTLSGGIFEIEVEASDTVGNVKAKIQDKYQIPIKNQKLIFDGKEMKDDRTLNYYRIRKEETLHMVERYVCIHSNSPFYRFCLHQLIPP